MVVHAPRRRDRRQCLCATAAALRNRSKDRRTAENDRATHRTNREAGSKFRLRAATRPWLPARNIYSRIWRERPDMERRLEQDEQRQSDSVIDPETVRGPGIGVE